MDKNANNFNKNRQSLISQLSDNIVNSFVSLFKERTDQKTRDKIVKEVNERLNFEINVTLNELVTKYAPEKRVDVKEEAPPRTFERFGKNFRAQHMLMFVSVIILVITGMPLKFPEFDFAKFIIIDLLGGLENSTFLHRVGAVGLIIVGLWHLIYTVASRLGRRDFILMIPYPQDIKDFFTTIFYYIGRRKTGAKFGRFSFIEKFDYWAVYWGMIIMIGSGSIMWYKEIFPKYIFDIAREAHSDEGLLATLAIVVWHFYNVHFNPEVFPMSWAWWHGQLTEKEMKHHHPLEYAQIMEAESNEIISKQTQDNNSKEPE